MKNFPGLVFVQLFPFLFLMHHVRFHRRFPILSLYNGSFAPHRQLDIDLPELENSNDFKGTVDVIIPTLNRKETLRQVLKDLSTQNLLPSRVIIVEQDDQPGATSQLDYLEQDWPFQIIHEFKNTLGACSARNLAMTHIDSDYIFFADDDIRIPQTFLSNAINSMQGFKTGPDKTAGTIKFYNNAAETKNNA